MKRARQLIVLCCIVLLLWGRAFSQTPDAKSLTRDGVELANQKNYAAAIDKYKAALTLDADYAPGNYQMAFTLHAMGKGLDGISYLQKVFTSKTASANLVNGSYDLAGSIYDANHQPQKAIESYKAGIAANPTYQPLQYNLALAYFRNKQYADAEATAVQAIKLDPKHASSIRLYALVSFHQNKRAQALLGFCSFIIMEPNTARSAEAYGNIQHILKGGALPAEPGVTISPAAKAQADAQNKVLTKALPTGFKYPTPGDALTAQLKGIFFALGNIPEADNKDWHGLAAYFSQLAASPHMPAFARFISMSNPESTKWAKANEQKMADLQAWIDGTDRTF